MRLAAFAAALALIGGLAAVAGSALEPGRIGGEETTSDEHGSDEMTSTAETDAHGGDHGAPAQGEEEAPGGLAVAEAGYRLELDTTTMPAGERRELSFSIRDDAGRAVTDFDEEHGKRLHLILVRRDLSGFQHLHPELGADGTWSTSVELPEAGPYRVYADFKSGRDDLTLGADLTAAGEYDPRPLPAPSDVARTEGYEVTKHGHGDTLAFAVSRDGRPVRDLQPYLEARGHLVVIREGDLAYLHVHPEDESEDPSEIGFHAELPTAGRYRMYLQFRHEGQVRTVEFTEEVAR
jgi:hypothetical protein